MREEKREKIIEVVDLCFSYPDGHEALRGVSFSVYRGESLGLIGGNGAGKSTLLLHLNGVLQAKKGSVQIQGEEITAKNIKRLRAKVGLVFEDPRDQLFMPTLFDDIAFGLLNLGYEAREVEKKVREILKEFNLEGYEKRPPHRLSSGERKKASLATVLVLEPEVLVLDEPTATLDPAGKKSFLSLVEKIKKTKIIASHDLEMIDRLCSRVILMDKGRIVAEGRREEVLQNTALLEAYGFDPP